MAHRGDSLHAPENTLPAFREAVRKGYRGIEMDIWHSKNTKSTCIMVIHDSNLKSKTGKSMKTYNLNKGNRGKYKIKKNVHGISKYGAQTIPTLDEALNCVYSEAKKQGYNDFIIELDIKNNMSDGAVKYICNKVGTHKIHVLSSYQSTLKKFKKYRKSRNTQVWYCTGNNNKSKRMKNIRSACAAHFDGISIPLRNANLDTVKLVRSKGLQIGFYNIESPTKMQYWRSKGVTRFNVWNKPFIK